ncbi:MAG: hypothetical protein PHG82_05415 [Candidatus Gracilibacteria bacterium]|nr:hypothetical protein [Candidatus Gracilibacteria bacterium]
MTNPEKKYHDLETGESYEVNPLTKEGQAIIDLDSLFKGLKKDGLYDENKMKYGFFSPELSHKLFLIANNDIEKKEIVLDYLMKNIIDKELKREDIVFMFINDKTIKTKTGEKNIKESLIVRTNYYKAIGALVKGKIKKIITPNTDKIEASKHKEIINEIDEISNFACFAGEFSKNKESFDTKKRQIIYETLKSIFGEQTNIIIPRNIDADIKISKSNMKVKIDLDNLEKKVFPTKDDLRNFLKKSATSLGSDSILTSIPSNPFFTKGNFSKKLSEILKHNRTIKESGLDINELSNFSIKLVQKDLAGENIIINTLIKKLLNILNSGTSKGLGFYNSLIRSMIGHIPADLQKKIEPKARIQRSRDYVQNQRDLLLKKQNQINPDIIMLYEDNVLTPLVEAVKIYMSK